MNVESLPQLPVTAGLMALAHPQGVLACWPSQDGEPIAVMARKILRSARSAEAVTVTDDIAPVTLELMTEARPNGGHATFWRCPTCGARRRDLFLTPSLRCRGCARLQFESAGRAPCRLPVGLAAENPTNRVLKALLRTAAEPERVVWRPILVVDPLRAAALFENVSFKDVARG